MRETIKVIIIYLFIFSFFIFLSFSIYSYNPQDPGFGVTGAKEINNYCGILGAYFSSLLYLIFGFSSLFIPPLLFLGFVLHFQGISSKKIFFLFTGLLSSFALSFSLLFELLQVKNQDLWGKFPLHGGILGELSRVVASYLGIPGIFLLILVILIFSVFIVFEGFQRFKSKIKNLKIKNLKKEKPEDNFLEEKEFFPSKEKDFSTLPSQEVLEKPQESQLNELNDKKIKPGKLKLPPPLELLSDPLPTSYRVKPEELKERALLLKAKLREFGIEGEVTGINPGPVITVFEFKPAPGIKLSRILSLVDDLALGLSAKSVRIVAPIPGKSVIGIEISNPQREWVYLKEIISQEVFKASDSPLTFALGKDISGNPVVADLKKMPHLLNSRKHWFWKKYLHSQYNFKYYI